MKLVLLPGMDGTGTLFTRFIAAVQGEFNILIVSYPRRSPLLYAEMERVVRSAIPESEPFVLLAESFSSPVGIRLAANAPENLKGLVLCAGFASSPLRGSRRFAALALAPILFRWKPPGAVVRWLLIGRGGDSSLLAAIRAAMSEVKPGVLAARLRSVLNCDERMNMGRLELPILLIRPTQDRLIPDSAYEEIRAKNPIVEMVEVDGPHLIIQANPIQCAEKIASFMRRVCN